jgi:hypothetical protein
MMGLVLVLAADRPVLVGLLAAIFLWVVALLLGAALVEWLT